MSDHKRSTSDSGIQSTKAGSDNGYFIGTTKREDFWKLKMDAPYTKPTFFTNPGPGKYDVEKKKNDIKTKILNEETAKVPFNISDERDCNKVNVKQAMLPGPGAYIDINNPHHSSIAKPLLKFQSDRNFAE